MDRTLEVAGGRSIAAVEGNAADGPGLTLADVFRVLSSHVVFLLACTLGAVLACLLYIVLHHPVYSASAVIRIDPTRLNDLAVGPPQNGMPIDQSSVLQTEVGVLQSHRVALRTLSTLPSQSFQRATGLPASRQPSFPREVQVSKEDSRLLANFEEKVKIAPQTGTELISVTFTDRDPALAAEVANHLVAAYTAESLFSRKDSVSQLRSWLTQEIDSLRAQVDTAQNKLSQFQEANNILDTQATSNTTLDKLKILNDRLAQAQADRIVKEAALRSAETSTPEALASLYPSSNLTELQIQLAQLNTRFAQLASKFDSQYPPLVDLNRQITLVTSQLANNAKSVQRRLKQEFDSAQLVQHDLQAQYDAQLTLAYKLNRSQAEDAVLQSQVTSGRELLNLLQTRMQQAVVDAEVTGGNVVVVDGASVPSSPSGPKNYILLASSAILGFLAGAATSFLLGGTSRKIRLVSDVEKWTGVPVLAVVPDRPNPPRLNLGGSSTKVLSVLGDPRLVGVGPYREVRDQLLLHSSAQSKIYLVAGVTSAEDTDMATAHIAAAFSRAGYKVLVVDAFIRKPMTEKYSESNDATVGDTPRASAQSNPEFNGVSFLSLANNATPVLDQIASESFLQTMNGWASAFDFVLLRGGALLSSENLLLARHAGNVLLVTRYGSSSTDSIAKLRQTLAQIGTTLSGMLIMNGPPDAKEGMHVS